MQVKVLVISRFGKVSKLGREKWKVKTSANYILCKSAVNEDYVLNCSILFIFSNSPAK